MRWYQAVLLLGSIAMSLIILIRPTSDGRRMAFTLVLGALVLVTIGLAVKELTSVLSRLRDFRWVWLKYAEPVDAVQRCHFVAFCQGRVIEYRLDEVVDRSAKR